MLDVIGHVAQTGNGEYRRAHYILIVDETAVLGIVGVALGAEADDGGVLLVGDDAHHTVGGDGVLVQHEGDGLAHFNGVGVHLLHVDQGTNVIGRLHGAGQHGEYLQPDQPGAHQQNGQDHHQRHRNAADRVPDSFNGSIHNSSFLTFFLDGAERVLPMLRRGIGRAS